MSLLSAKQINALTTLGWALVKHVLARPFIGRHGPGHWLERLREEDLAPQPRDAWSILNGSSRCIGCGLCDLVAEPHEEPSQWILGWARQPADAPLSVAQAERLAQLAPQIRAICPARVPVEQWVEHVRENARMLETK